MQKSASTRVQILDAALRRFVEMRYANTTTTAIAEKAGLSRGAMLHHFPSKLAIVRAAVEHLHARRLKAFKKSIERVSLGDDGPRKALEVCLEHVRHPLYVAFLELGMAARTDAEVLAILRPTPQAFEVEWHRMAVDPCPEWRESGTNLDLALDLVWYEQAGWLERLLGTSVICARISPTRRRNRRVVDTDDLACPYIGQEQTVPKSRLRRSFARGYRYFRLSACCCPASFACRISPG